MLLEVRDLEKRFRVGGGFLGARGEVRAVDGISFEVPEGGAYALVGESGCGKTTVARMVLLLETPTAGTMRFDGEDLTELSGAGLKRYRSRAQAVFQDPYASLNPRLRVRTIIAEPILAHRHLAGAALRARVAELLDVVGLPGSAADLYPHEFSGGQRQRIAIARALALEPKFLVLDEPISALDVSIRAQVLNLLADIQRDFGLTYLIIAHDLALVEHFSSHVGVMYLGALVESGPTEAVFGAPRHPYTQALLASVSRPDPDHRPDPNAIKGEIPSPLDPPPGCKFHTRCPHVMDVCRVKVPARRDLGGGQAAACHLLDQAP